MKSTTHILLFLTTLCLLFSSTASASIVISQVLYDPIGTESGGEAVQLKNTGTTPVALSGWTLRTSTSAVDAVIPDDVILSPESVYLIADTGWSEKKDDLLWPEADTEQSLTLKNSDSGVALFNDTLKIDAVGWGAPEDPLLYEGTPAPLVEAGQSLVRIQDTQNNAADFETKPASFLGPASSDMSHDLLVSVTVTESSFFVEDTILTDDDLSTSGIQIIPAPGSERIVPVTVRLNSTADAKVTAEFLGQDLLFEEQPEGFFYSTLMLPSTLFPSTYELHFTAATAHEQFDWTQDFEVMGVVAFSLSSSDLDFGNLSLQESSVEEIVITNLGNIALDLGVDGTDLAFGEEMLSLDHLTVHYDEVDDPGRIVPVTSLPQILNTDILPGSNATLGLELRIPEQAAAGTYTGLLTLLGIGN